MIYTFVCSAGHVNRITGSISKGPPAEWRCTHPVGRLTKVRGRRGTEWAKKCCWKRCERDWKADAPMLDTSSCRDPNAVATKHQVRSGWDRGSPEKIEGDFKRHVHRRRTEIKDAGGQRGSLKQTHAVPAHLYHGKIKESGDKNYWSDPKNLAKHKDCKVD